jgi:predicted peptidase
MKSLPRWLFVCLLILFVVQTLSAQRPPRPGTQVPQSYQSANDAAQKLDYLLYLPDGYSNSKTQWPLVIFLHGSGERGHDLAQVKKHGPPKVVETEGFPFILVSPQCPSDVRWREKPVFPALQGLLREIKQRYSVDADRIYLTGLSMGAQGTWFWASEDPIRFAAILPVCGKCEPEWGKKVAHLPTWVFHGAKDNVVPLSQSEAIIAEMEAAGGKPKLTVYPDAQHDSWTETYQNLVMYDWLLNHTRDDHLDLKSATQAEPLSAPKPTVNRQ